MKRRLMVLGNIVALVALLVSLAACGGESARPLIAQPASQSASPPSDITSGKDGTTSDHGLGPSGGYAAAEATSTTASTSGETNLFKTSPSTTGGDADLAEPMPSAESSGGHSTGRPYQQYQSDLTAGQVDDNAKFSEYLDYLRNFSGGSVMPVDVSQRLFVRVMDASQQPVAGAQVQLYDGNTAVFDGSTMSNGRVLFFPSAAHSTQAQEYRAVITRGQTSVEATIKPGNAEQVITLAGLKDNSGPVGIDLVFLLDATGSMADEIEKIKGTVGSIAERIEQLPGSSAPRFGLVAFRDRGDDYVTRSWDFTSNIDQFSDNLSNVYAAGGGDIPESVNAGLYDAINLSGWADNSAGRHLRMIVLVGDAPPHIDYQDDYRYPTLLQAAVGSGIKIFPVGASNLESDGEYIFRQFAEITQGQFVFLTYANGVSGAPGLSTDKHVSDFTVQNLDSLIVNLVAGEVANQTGQSIGTTNPQPEQVVAPVQVKENVAKPAPALTGLAALLDDFVGGRGGIVWVAVLLIVAAVVLSTRKQITARVAPAQAEEIYIPESSIEPQPVDDQTAMLAAHLQPEVGAVEVYLNVAETQQPTIPLR